MILHGKLIKGTKTLKEALVEKSEEGISFRDALEECFIDLCKELDIQVPIWLGKNTTEFVNYRRTFFDGDQFMEKVSFDRFEVRFE
ncbi:MAG TPA: hypothetical protein GXX14_05055 [Clostridiaceae bacterium]|nr:hypothetical protein [Clostridiaceae bacterium]